VFLPQLRRAAGRAKNALESAAPPSAEALDRFADRCVWRRTGQVTDGGRYRVTAYGHCPVTAKGRCPVTA
jgi:hypothetical protein